MRPGDLGTPRSWLIPIGVGVAGYAVASHGLIQVGVQAQLPLLVGITVGLAAATPLQGAIVSALCVVVGMLVAPPLAPNGVAALPGAGTFASFAIVAVLAAAAGALPPFARHRVEGAARRNVTVAISAVLVACAVVNLWLPFAATGLPPQSYGPITVGLANQVPVPGQYQSDSAVYRRVFYLMHDGQAYYPAFHDAYAGLGPAAVPLNSPVTVRLPTYFWLLMLLPPQGFAILYAFFAFASVGVIACALIAGQIVGPRLAPVAALTFAAYVSGVSHTGGVFAVDLPSVCIALVGVALFLLAIRTESAYALWGAVAVMIAAALMREILVYLPVFVAVSAALEPRGERLRRAVPWLVGLAVFALGYAAHSLSAWPYLAHGTRGFTYLHGGPAFVLDGLTRFSDRVAAGGPALVCFVLLGVVGAVASRRRVGDRFAAFATAAIVLPFLGMLLVGNQGVDTTGALTNYWGSLVVPLALALWPACALLLAPRAPVPRVGRSRSR